MSVKTGIGPFIALLSGISTFVAILSYMARCALLRPQLLAWAVVHKQHNHPL